MIDLRSVTPDFAVAGQVAPEDVPALKAQGFTTLINNRPDGETPDQPAAAAIAAEARKHGIAYVEVPVRGSPTLEQAHATVVAASGKTLAFCRSGTRSVMAWALGHAAGGRHTPAEVINLAAQAGYDLRPMEAALLAAAPPG